VIEIEFTVMTHAHRAEEVLAMMQALYSEDEPASAPDPKRFPRTIELLLAEPAKGRIVLFIENAVVRGYALLIPYWSNEFGGTLLFVDEIFVVQKSRCQGIGRRFFQFMAANKPFDAVALALEVSPRNTRARKFYTSMGFEHRKNSMMTLGISG